VIVPSGRLALLPDDSIAAAPRCMIRVSEFCKQGRIAKSTAFRWIADGKLRAYRVGQRMTFVDETFEQFVLRQAAERATEAGIPIAPASARGWIERHLNAAERPPPSEGGGTGRE
jgi:excisionase family DNA binding protein